MSQDIKPTKLHNDIIKTKSNEPTHQSAYQLTTRISPISQAQPTQPSIRKHVPNKFSSTTPDRSNTNDAIYICGTPLLENLRDCLIRFKATCDQEVWVSTGFAYQSKTNDYKVVKLWSTPVVAEVYTLSSDSC